MKKASVFNSQKGTVLVIALLILLVLTLIGTSSIMTTIFEIRISGNDRFGIQAFYAAEAGIQAGIHQLPDVTPVPRTEIGEEASFWSGTREDADTPQPFRFVGRSWMAGFQVPGSEPTPGEFLRYQLNAAGESLGSMREIEVQVRYGPVTTQY